MRLFRAASCLLFVLLVPACLALPSTDDGGTGGGGGGGGTAGASGGGAGDAGPAVDAGAPEKVVFLFEWAPSLAVTDPDASRVEALRRALGALQNDPRVSVAVMSCSGTLTAVLSGPVLDFVPLSQLGSADLESIYARLPTYYVPTSDGGFPRRDWVAPLSTLYSLLYRDTQRALTLGEPQARYTVVFVTDGAPTDDQDDALLCGPSVTQLRDLATSALDVRFHTVLVHLPRQPSSPCTEDAGVVAGGPCSVPARTNPVCPSVQVDLDAERLRRMASLGGGRALDFRRGPVDFSSLVP